jgi:cytoskeletal protein CcmA (bactofilin family)
MALFRRKEEEPMAKQPNTAVSNQINMIGEGTVFEGTLTSESDIRISGRVEGKLEVKGKLIIAQEGQVEGEITAASLDVAGRVQGEIRVEERVVLKSSAVVDGNVQTGRIVIEEGAVYNGKCQMGSRTMTSDTKDRKTEPSAPSDLPVRRASA